MKYFISFVVSILIVSSSLFSVSAASSDSYQTQLVNIEQELRQDPDNPILQMEKNMLNMKLGNVSQSNEDIFNWRTYPTALSHEINGGIGLNYGTNLIQEFGILTGQRAINESLQLDSIGSVQGFDPHDQLLRDVRASIESYNGSFGSYPVSLDAFDAVDYSFAEVWWDGEMRNIADLTDLLAYTTIKSVGTGATCRGDNCTDTTKGMSYTLSLKEATSTYTLEDVQALEIASHPWQEMLQGRTYDIPPIAKAVPADLFFVNFEVPEKALDLEKILVDFSSSFGDLYQLGELSQIKPRMMQRLNIPDIDQLVYGVSELAFVSEDLSFSPKTDFALILKFKNEIAKMGFSFLDNDKVLSRDIGDYTVIATDTDILDKVQDAYTEHSESMAIQSDYHYMLASLEERRSVLVYFSEEFIRKLTSPTYRIKASRRLAVINALETLQYAVFAYRGIAGEWPESFSSMATQGFIDQQAIYELNKYRISGQGIVSHTEWGSLWDIKPVNQVPITNITFEEKANYDSFTQGYQGFFREFFDPIGVAITVSDQVMFHTIILPLIDETEYNLIKTITDSDNSEIAFFSDPDRVGAINLVSKFSLDSLLIQGAQLSEEWPENWQKILTEDEIDELYLYFADGMGADMMDIQNDISAIWEDTEDTHNDISEVNPKELLAKLRETERTFDFTGDEIILGVGEKNSFEIKNIADIDVWLGITITDKQKAEIFINNLYKTALNLSDSDFSQGLFRLSSDEPVKNEYEGTEYYVIPTGFVNLYYIFFDDVLYISISQKSINALIDSKLYDDGNTFSNSTLRGLDFTGLDHHILGTVDFEKVTSNDFEIPIIKETYRSVLNEFKAQSAYLREALTLAEILPDYDGSLKNIADYYHLVPDEYLNGAFTVKDGDIYFGSSKDNETLLENIDAGSKTVDSTLSHGSDTEKSDGEQAPMVSVFDLVDADATTQSLLDSIRSFKSLVLATTFTNDGLDIRIALGNPLVDENDIVSDDRFENVFTHEISTSVFSWWHYLLVVLVGFAVLLLIIRHLMKDEKVMYEKSVHIFHGMKFNPDQDHIAEKEDKKTSDQKKEEETDGKKDVSDDDSA